MIRTPIAPEPLNYTVKAITSLEALAKRLSAAGHPDLTPVLDIINYLKRAVVFVLPQINDLIDPDSLQRATEGTEMARLPFPVCSFESHYTTLHLSEQYNVAYPKRISLCIETEALTPGPIKSVIQKAVSPMPEGVVSISITEVPAEYAGGLPGDERWSAFPFAGMTPRTPSSKMGDVGKGAYFQLGINRDNHPVKLDAGFYLAPICAVQAGMYMDNIEAGGRSPADSAAGDLFDEVLAPLVVTSILSCRNTTVEYVEASPKLNKKRAAAGKPPIPGYSFISISSPPDRPVSTGQRSSHTSPRGHLRRGHIRRYRETGKTIWIQATMVNAGSNDQAKQIYKVK